LSADSIVNNDKNMCLATSTNSSPTGPATDTNCRGLTKLQSTVSTTSACTDSSFDSTDEMTTSAPPAGNMNIVATFENVDCNEILKFFKKTSVLQDFFNPSKPWVLVPRGSFMGNFDWVPAKFREGPWHPACAAYLVVVTAWIWSECAQGFAQEPFPSFEPVQAWTLSWYYNAAAFAWISLMVYKIFCSGMGWTSWGMYTVWSWTFTWMRHGLSAAAPFKPEWTAFNEQIRFPMLVQATLTFAVWNAVIGPSIYAQMTTPEMKASFCRFFGNFLWRQMHVYNIVYAAVNGIWGSPGRSLTKSDFAVALAICLIYAYFYLVVMDRLGVHYYLVFSPRTPFALISWTLLFACYYACFPVWNVILTKYS